MAAPDDTCQVERVASALVYGHARTEYLGISEAEMQAIVPLEIERASGEADLCTGVVIGREAVLTAAHCFDDDAQAVRIGGRVWRKLGADALTVQVSPQRDVALLQLPRLDGRTVLAWSAEDSSRFRRSLVEIAGAGLTEDGSAGLTAFAVAEVLSVNARYLDVRSTQAGGPCGGDSGGPLLVRGASGRVEVAGVLSKGDPDCNGPDRYERVDGLDAWLSERVEAVAADRADCGSITARGRCFGPRAVWCDAGQVRSQDCADGASCGWSLGSAGFRCLPLEADPCAGVPDSGACVDGAALRCVEGQLERLRCGECGGSCQISSRSGMATCAIAQPE